MKGHSNTFFNLLATLWLTLLLVLTLFPDFMLSLFSIDTDLYHDMANMSPGWGAHQFLGTNNMGQSTLALIIAATRYSVLISVCAAVLATLLGILIGGVSSFFGDHQLKIKRSTIVSALVLLPILFFELHMLLQATALVLILGTLLTFMVGYLFFRLFQFLLHKIDKLAKPVFLPLDFMVVKCVEIMFAIPTYFILLALAGLFTPSLQALVCVIGITSWSHAAMLIRSQMLAERDKTYMQALRLGGLSYFAVFFKHALPNTIRPVLVDMVFFASSLLVVESTLSFIGIGLPGDIITWGKILSAFRYNSANWWSIVFPGVVIFCTVLSFHSVAKQMRIRLRL
jgi:peptide/nickel transport system permease protein